MKSLKYFTGMTLVAGSASVLGYYAYTNYGFMGTAVLIGCFTMQAVGQYWINRYGGV